MSLFERYGAPLTAYSDLTAGTHTLITAPTDNGRIVVVAYAITRDPTSAAGTVALRSGTTQIWPTLGLNLNSPQQLALPNGILWLAPEEALTAVIVAAGNYGLGFAYHIVRP